MSNVKPAKTIAIAIWNVAGAISSPKLIRLNSKSPEQITNAVLGRSLGSTGIWQYPLQMSKFEK